MILKQLYMRHFGRFNDEKIELKPGINVIYGENESGKTTISAFIQTMLFGTEHGRGRAAMKDMYNRYLPRTGGTDYSGVMLLNHDGDELRLIRNLYKSEDSFKVEDLTKGTVISDNQTENITDLIPELTKNVYVNTLNVRQGETDVDSRFGTDLQAYMGNIMRTRQQDVSLTGTLDYLRQMEKDRKKGDEEKKLQTNLNQLKKLQVTEEDFERLAEEEISLKAELKQVRAQLTKERAEEKERALREQKEKMIAIQMIEENNRLASQYNELKADLTALGPARDPAEEKRLKDELDNADAAWEDAKDNYSDTGGSGMAAMFSVIMFGLLPLLGVMFFVHTITIKVAVIVAFVLAVLLTMKIASGRRTSAKEAMMAAQEYRDRCYEAYMQAAHGRQDQEERRRIKAKMEEVRDQYKALQEPLQPYLDKFGTDITLEQSETASEYVPEREAALWQKEEALLNALEKNRIQKETLDEQAVIKEELLEENRELTACIDKRQEEAACIEECMSILKELSEEIHADYGPSLGQKASEMMYTLTGGRYDRILVGRELGIRLDTEEGFLEPGQVSEGTRVQLNLALRLAMIKLCFPKDDMPVILDDSFVTYDDRRLERTLMWLSRQGFGQIILLTCQKREGRLLQRCGIPFHQIELPRVR